MNSTAKTNAAVVEVGDIPLHIQLLYLECSHNRNLLTAHGSRINVKLRADE